jgi:hypothetical protein
MVLNIQNISEKLLGVHHLGYRSITLPIDIHFLWVDEHIEGLDSQYRIGFTYGGTEYSTYLHRYPQTTNHYHMGCYGPNMKEYRFRFHYNDFFTPTAFIKSLIRQLDIDANN